MLAKILDVILQDFSFTFFSHNALFLYPAFSKMFSIKQYFYKMLLEKVALAIKFAKQWAVYFSYTVTKLSGILTVLKSPDKEIDLNQSFLTYWTRSIKKKKKDL